MWEITVPPPVEVRNMLGQRLRDEQGEPATFVFKDFVLARAQDPAFAKTKPGMEAVYFWFGFKQHMEGQDFTPGKKLKLEDEEKHALVRACKEGTFDPMVGHCFVPFLDAVMNATEVKPEPKAKPVDTASPAAPAKEDPKSEESG
jgi:hypothetical protein